MTCAVAATPTGAPKLDCAASSSGRTMTTAVVVAAAVVVVVIEPWPNGSAPPVDTPKRRFQV